MSSRDFSIAGFIGIAVAILLLHLWGRRDGSVVPSLGQLFTEVLASTAGRVLAMACWLWVGWHLFAR